MESVKQLIEEINKTRSQTSASTKDEQRVMKAMLNDPTYKVDVWSRSGIEGQYCPYEEARSMVANIIKDTTKISAKEAEELANNYNFGRQESGIMIGIAKEFVNTYIETGRKLPLGGRKNSNISIAKKNKPAVERTFNKKVGVNNDGTDKFEQATVQVPEHGSLKVYSSAPSWIK